MPVVKRRSGEQPDVRPYTALVDELVRELTGNNKFGQPIVEEEALPRTGLTGVNVFWDQFVAVPDRDRPAVIQEAYRRANSPIAERLAFAIGYTIPEAAETELLPYHVLLNCSAGTSSDVLGQYKRVMIELGASTLIDSNNPQLRLPTFEQAAECRSELIRRFAGTEGVWVLGQGNQFYRTANAAGVPLVMPVVG
jgi:hypothetical protein